MKATARWPFLLAVLVLITMGIGLALLRHVSTGTPLLPGKSQPVWLIEARIDFEATGEPVLVSLEVPSAVPGYRQQGVLATSPGYGFAVIQQPSGARAEWSRSAAFGTQTLYYKTQFLPVSAQPVVTEARPAATRVFWEEPQASAALALQVEAQARASSPQSLTRELLKLLATDDQNAALLLAFLPQPELVVRLLNQVGVPARLAEGLFLQDARRRQTLQPFLQIHDGEQWLTYDLRTGEQGLPADVLLWRQGGASLLDVDGGENSSVSFSLIRQSTPVMQMVRAEAQQQRAGAFSLHQLPVEEQGMFRMLLLLPLGALIVAFMRIVIGVRTSGTFMPVLIAMAFVQTSLVPGLFAFVTVVGLGLILRGYLARLNLLLVSRISALILLVIFITLTLSLIGYQLGYSTGMTVTFFPMVIMAWTIERMSILWEEEGGHEVAVQGLGSLFVAICTYFVMLLPVAGHLTFNFPELHLVTLGLILLLGNYTGYKLTELRRFAPMKDLKG